MPRLGALVLSCSRAKELSYSLLSYSRNLPGEIWGNSLLHEDEFENVLDEVDTSMFAKVIKTSPSLGLGHALYASYNAEMILSCNYIVHLEDDWLMMGTVPAMEICHHMDEHGLVQVILSSKMNLEEARKAAGDPDIMIDDGRLGIYFKSKRRKINFGHMIPNTTPSILRPMLFDGYRSDIDILKQGKGDLLEGKSKFIDEFDPENPFMIIHSPLRAWKFWKKSLRFLGKPLFVSNSHDWAFVFQSGRPLMKHIGAYGRRRIGRGKGKKYKSCSPEKMGIDPMFLEGDDNDNIS
jgi:hypothetical protein